MTHRNKATVTPTETTCLGRSSTIPFLSVLGVISSQMLLASLSRNVAPSESDLTKHFDHERYNFISPSVDRLTISTLEIRVFVGLCKSERIPVAVGVIGCLAAAKIAVGVGVGKSGVDDELLVPKVGASGVGQGAGGVEVSIARSPKAAVSKSKRSSAVTEMLIGRQVLSGWGGCGAEGSGHSRDNMPARGAW